MALNCATLILHGTNDQIVPYMCGFNLSLKFKNLYSFYTLYGCDHDDIFTKDYYKHINEFLKV